VFFNATTRVFLVRSFFNEVKLKKNERNLPWFVTDDNRKGLSGYKSRLRCGAHSANWWLQILVE
jgi:hypothetical protein